MTIYLPNIDWSKRTASGGVTESGTLNESATSAEDRQLTVAAEHAFIRTIYGEDRVGAQIANVATNASGSWVIQAVWCEGEIDSINDVLFNDEAMPSGVTVTHYTGAPGQTADPTLSSAISGYADALPGIAYSVFVIPPTAVDGFPQITARIKGLKIYDTRTTLTAYNDNPAQVLRDFIVRATGRSVIASTVTTVANDNDELVSGVKRRTIGLTMESSQDVSQWIDTLCTYASCWCVMQGASVALVSDRPRATDFTLDHSAGQILSLKVKKRGIRNTPTCVRVRYTNTTENPWRDDWEEYDSGANPRRESEVALPGYHSAAQAKREAIERYNKQNLNDLSVEVEVFDEGLSVEVGDVGEITHPIGFVSKKFRVLGVSGELGRYKLSLIEYDPATYSDVATSTPTYSDTNNVSALNPPAPTNLVGNTDIYQLENGTWSSRIVLTWDLPTVPYLNRFSVQIEQAGIVVDARSLDATEYKSPPIVEGFEYVCKVATVSSIGVFSSYSQVNVLAGGKTGNYIPSDVTNVQCFEAGGKVFVSWSPSIDTDMWRYEIRYGNSGWDSATVIDRVDALRVVAEQIPVGTWNVYVKGLDSVGQYSANAAWKSVTVTSDASAFLVDSKDQTSPTLTNMAEYSLRADTNRYFITEDGVGLGTKMPGALSAYTGALATHHSSVTSTWLGEADDYGQLLSGQWTVTATVEAINGSLISYLGLSPDMSGWTYYAGLSHKQNGRGARIKHESLTTSTLKVTIPTQNIRIDAVPREEVGTGTSSGSGSYVTVTLENVYVAVKKLTITPLGSAARMAVADMITVGSPTTFRVWMFDAAGAVAPATSFRYEWQGV